MPVMDMLARGGTRSLPEASDLQELSYGSAVRFTLCRLPPITMVWLTHSQLDNGTKVISIP